MSQIKRLVAAVQGNSRKVSGRPLGKRGSATRKKVAAEIKRHRKIVRGR